MWVEMVTDAAGQPLVVYHGTNSDPFDQFSPHHIGTTDDGYYGRGFYFSPNEEDAATYGRRTRGFHLKINRPFVVPSSGHMSHDSLFDLRDQLAALNGGPAELRSNRTLPSGYRVEEREEENRYHNPRVAASRPTRTVYFVSPDPSLYGTDGEVYGPEEASPLAAIVKFNDQVKGEKHDYGWAAGLLRSATDRNRFVDLLKQNGYDGIFVMDPDNREVHEYVAFEPSQIVPAGEWK